MSKNTSTDHRTDDSESLRKEAYKLLSNGVQLINARQFTEAIPILQKAHDFLPDDPDILITLGGAMVMAGKWNKAERFLEKAVEKYPDNALLWLNLAAAILGHLHISPRSRQDKAIAAYERAIELNPAAPNAHYNVGLIHAERKDWEQAIKWFETAVRVNPRDKDARLWLERARRAYADQQDASSGQESEQ